MASLLAVFAHPDDESLACGGLLARCAEEGVSTALLCLSRGEHGPGEATGGLGATRERELRQAARVLGVDDVTVLDHEDGMLPWIEPARLQADVLAAIRLMRPEVVVTFDEDGLYWHPDHVAVHERVTAAVAALGDDAPALWYVSLPGSAMRAVWDAAPDGAAEAARLFDVPVDAYGEGAPEPSLTLALGAGIATRKLAALRCHRSQVAGSALDRIAERDAERLLATEHYRRAPMGPRAETLLERLATPATATRS